MFLSLDPLLSDSVILKKSKPTDARPETSLECRKYFELATQNQLAGHATITQGFELATQSFEHILIIFYPKSPQPPLG